MRIILTTPTCSSIDLTTMYSGCQQYLLPSPVNGEIAADVIRENFTKLTERIEATWLVTNLFEKNLLPKPILNKVLINDSLENLSLALLKSADIIKSDGEKFNDFLVILAKDSVYKSLIPSLKTDYGKYNHNNLIIIVELIINYFVQNKNH